MLLDRLISFSIIGGSALILLGLIGGQYVEAFSNTTTVAQVVKDFNDTKHFKARALRVPVPAMPEVSHEKIMETIGRLYAASDASSNRREMFEEAICTHRLPVSTNVSVLETGRLDSEAEVQLELRFGYFETNHWYLGSRKFAGFAVPLEL